MTDSTELAPRDREIEFRDDWTPAVPQSKDSPAVRDIICGRIAQGETMHQILQDPNRPAYLPNYRQVWKWLTDPRDRHAEFRDMFLRAQQSYTFNILERAEHHALQPMLGWTWDEKKGWRQDSYAIQHLRVLLEHFRWRSKNILPYLFGNTLRVETKDTTEDKGPRIDWTKLSDSAIREVQAAMYWPEDQQRDERVVGEGGGNDK